MPQSPKIMIATPVRGEPHTSTISYAYFRALDALRGFREIRTAAWFTNCDLVRARSRAVRVCLQAPEEFTHLLFWDEDVVPRDPIEDLTAMLASGKDMIALPYPHKLVDWEAIAAGVRDGKPRSGIEIEALGNVLPLWVQGGGEVVGGVAEIEACGFGFVLLSRGCLERMVSAYGGARAREPAGVRDPDVEALLALEKVSPPGMANFFRHVAGRLGKSGLVFNDHVDGGVFPTVALFSLVMNESGDLLHEDYSFCKRWRDIGGKIHVLADPGVHVGRMSFRGHPSSLVKVEE